MDLLPKKPLPLKKLLSQIESPIRKIPKDQIILETRKLEDTDPGLNISNSNLTININIDASNLGATLKEVSSRFTNAAAAGFAGVAALGAAAAFFRPAESKKEFINPRKVKLPPMPQIKLPKL